jgi:predicted O-methyltransferase YrrM
MEYDRVRKAVDGVPNMSAAEGLVVYEHLRAENVRDVLEIGTAHAVSASYMAAAVDENGGGSVTTVDHAVATADRHPAPADVLARTGLDRLVERVLVTDSSYTWWLMHQVRRHTDESGLCHPQYDFVYIDGAHNWTIDGLTVYLVEKLMRPGGCLLLDDLRWSYDPRESTFGRGQGPDDIGLSDAERGEPHMQAVFDLIVRQHPNLGEFRIENLDWGWARKIGRDPQDRDRAVTMVESDVPLRIRSRQRVRNLRNSASRAKRSIQGRGR